MAGIPRVPPPLKVFLYTDILLYFVCARLFRGRPCFVSCQRCGGKLGAAWGACGAWLLLLMPALKQRTLSFLWVMLCDWCNSFERREVNGEGGGDNRNVRMGRTGQVLSVKKEPGSTVVYGTGLTDLLRRRSARESAEGVAQDDGRCWRGRGEGDESCLV